MNNEDSARRMEMYRTVLNDAVKSRKENITTKELAEKLSVAPTSLYRLERGTIDIRVSTFLAYLDGFGFTIEIIPNEEKRTVTESVSGSQSVDKVLKVNDIPIVIENIGKGSDWQDRRSRLRLLQYLLKMEEMYLENE
jgi:transcriptional regulator with XRE-family HTH domain